MPGYIFKKRLQNFAKFWAGLCKKVKKMDNEYELLLLSNQICFPTYAVANKILRRYQPLLKQLDLTYTQYVTMMVLWEKKVVNEKDLCKALYLKANTLTDLLQKLKKKGYVDITRDLIDMRNITISLTEKGMNLREKAVDIPKTLACEHWLTDEEFVQFKTLLCKLLQGDWEK